MENLNPCNIQRSLGEIRCLFCFVYLTLIVFFLFCFFCSCTSCFLRNKNGLWLLKLTPICQGGEESFGLNWKIFIFFCKKKKEKKISSHGSPPADRLAPLYGRTWAFSFVSSVSVLAKKVVQKPLPAQLCWVMSILAEVYTNVWCSPCLHLCT